MTFKNRIEGTLEEIREAGLFKTERVITTPQRVEIRVQGGREVLNFCANNYLGLADHPQVIAAAHEAMDQYGGPQGLVGDLARIQRADTPERFERLLARLEAYPAWMAAHRANLAEGVAAGRTAAPAVVERCLDRRPFVCEAP